MKSRKGKKKRDVHRESDKYNQSEASELNESGNDCSVTNKSSNIESCFPEYFTVLLDCKTPYSKLKTKNAAFLHPSIIQAYKSPWYFIIKGEQNTSLCTAYPMQSIKKSTIVLPNDSMGFKHEELVKFCPYEGEINYAANITVTAHVELNSEEILKELVWDALISRRFFYSGMKLIHKSSVNEYEFTITKVTTCEVEISEDTSLNMNNTGINLTGMNSEPAMSFEKYSSELISNFSSLSLKDNMKEMCKNSDCHPSRFQMDAEVYSKLDVPTFFTFSYMTSISIQTLNNSKPTVLSPSFSTIGGMKQEDCKRIKCFIDMCLQGEEKPYLGILLFSGPSGTGKTLMLEAIYNEYNMHMEKILWFSLHSMTLAEAERELREAFQRARNRAPSVILVDDLNYLMPANGDIHSRISKALSIEIEKCIGLHVMVVATVNSTNYDSEMMKSWNIMVEEINLNLPDITQREDIVLKSLAEKRHNLNSEEIKQIASASQGFSGKDLKDIISDAKTFQYFNRRESSSLERDGDDSTITFTNIKKALKSKKPSVTQSEIKIKKVKWNDIGGMTLVKERLRDIVEGPLKYPDIYKRFDVKPSRGILLYGPPGCSKTMIAKALATECDLNFITKNVSDIHNKYVGESEKAVSDLFLTARAKAPCIVFLDEIDALIPHRGSSTGSGVEERVVNTFLQEIDGIEELNNVIIVAATNRPDRIDEAFLRYGRINHYIYIPLPDTEAREEILKLQMKKRIVASDMDYNYLALKTESYSGAEIVNLCNEAAMQLLTEDFHCESPQFKMKHFEKALKIIVPKTSKELLDFYENFHSKYNSK